MTLSDATILLLSVNDNDPHIWEYEDAMRFLAPDTRHTVHHADGDITLEGQGCQADIYEGWFNDTKRRINALNRADFPTGTLARRLTWMSQSKTEAELKEHFEVFEATLDGLMDDLIEALHAKYEDD